MKLFKRPKQAASSAPSSRPQSAPRQKRQSSPAPLEVKLLALEALAVVDDEAADRRRDGVVMEDEPQRQLGANERLRA